MFKSKKTIFGVLGILVVAFIAVAGVAGFGAYHYVAAQVQPTPTPGQAAQSTSILDNYWATFLKNFAANLGVDQAKVDQAWKDAINATVDQAVTDGKLTQAQADSIKSRNSNGLSGSKGLPFFGEKGFGGRGGFGKMGFRGEKLTTADIAVALGMTEADVVNGLQGGKSIADLAKAQNKDLAAVKDALLAAVKARLDASVKDGSLTQAQADQVYQNLTTNIDAILNQVDTDDMHGMPGFGMRGFGKMESITTADIASALGMTDADVISGLQSGKSVADLAKAQNKDLAAVKEALLAAQKTRLDNAVKAGTITQAQADQVYQNLTNNIDAMLNQARLIGRGGMFGGKHGGFWGQPGTPDNNNNNKTQPAPSRYSSGA